MNPVPGRGFGAWGRGFGAWGRGRGGGRGWRNRFYATGFTGWQRTNFGWPETSVPWSYAGAYQVPFAPGMTREQETDFLKGQVEFLEDSLEGLRKRLEELEAKTQKA
jgi:hypothetical protein